MCKESFGNTDVGAPSHSHSLPCLAFSFPGPRVMDSTVLADAEAVPLVKKDGLTATKSPLAARPEHEPGPCI